MNVNKDNELLFAWLEEKVFDIAEEEIWKQVSGESGFYPQYAHQSVKQDHQAGSGYHSGGLPNSHPFSSHPVPVWDTPA